MRRLWPPCCWRATEAPRDAALTGVVIGLALTAKQTAPLLAALLGALAALYLVRGERRRAIGMLLALGIALLLWLPVLTRNVLLFGSPLYPHLSDVQRTLVDLSTRSFQLTPPRFYVAAFETVGPMVLVATLAALIWAARQRRWGLPSAILGLGGLAILAAPWVPRLEHRHLNPVCAVLALLASLVFTRACGTFAGSAGGSRSSCWRRARCSSSGCPTCGRASTCRPGWARRARRSIVRSPSGDGC